MANSYNGWQASPVPALIGINTNWSVLGTRPFSEGGFAGGVKGGDVATVFTALVTRLHNEVEPMTRKDGVLGYGCWGYEYRANVNNPSQLSCHASGTAIDYNAHKHPNGTVAPGGRSGWTSAQGEKIRAIIADLGGVIRWLWSNDPMHFEIIGSEAQVAAVAARLRREPEKPVTPGLPSTPPVQGNNDEWWFDMATEDQKQEMRELVYGGLRWFFQDVKAGLDLPVLRDTVAAGVRSSGADVRGQVRQLLLDTANGDDGELLQGLKRIIHDGANWAKNDPNTGDQAGFKS